MGGLPVLDRVAYAFHRELCQAASFARLSAISPPRQDARHPPRQQSSAPRILLPLIVSHPPSLFLHLAISAVLLHTMHSSRPLPPQPPTSSRGQTYRAPRGAGIRRMWKTGRVSGRSPSGHAH
ncbi:hypothetical protein BD310DRAFT_917327 [Dichomitus squalens]|uniref:Uncharacterized protein n=1 Tax=Dichomitus squalens TaxID=114155 RepID=A0A4V2K981_9APHY|nr:hypothetical protein BD310DRAFT_917327 [Dichomitus squalens]